MLLVDHLLKTNKEYKNFLKKGDSKYIYQNKLDKACFQYDMVYGQFKDLLTRTAAEELLHNKVFNIGRNSKYDGYQCGLAPLAYKFYNKKSFGSSVKSEILSNQQLAE